MIADLDLPVSPHAAVFRAIDQILRNDLTLKRVLTTIRSWQGNPADGAPPSSAQLPWVGITPVPRPMAWQTPDSQVGDLLIQVEIATAGLKVDNAMNLWHAVVRALLPTDQTASLAIQKTLIAAGSQTGCVDVVQPAYKLEPEAATTYATGHLAVDVRLEV